MTSLRGAKFIDDTIQARFGGISEFMEKRGRKKGLKAEQLYEITKGRHVPNAALLKAIEEALDINTPAEWWGWGSAIKP